MGIKILVLCRGNVVRSPFIACYLDYLYRTSGLADKMKLELDSSGIEGKTNYPVHPRTLAKGRELGFDMSTHRSRHANMKTLAEADIILITHKRQQRRFKEYMPHLMYKLFHLYDFGRDYYPEGKKDIEDPSQLAKGGKFGVVSEEDEQKAFDEFFEIIIPEVKRVWEYLKQVYLESLENNRDFNARLFLRKNQELSLAKVHYNFFTRFSFAMCPYCQSRRLKRNKRVGFIQRRILPLFNGYPYHCGRCKRNFILFVGAKAFSRKRSGRKENTWKRFIDKEFFQ